jgi:uncharacterized protein YyaL (SSP411 family)
MTTQHSGRRANRLADETSPYLLQHAYNPVDWHPWGDEAFARAKAEDKPIFLSVGYSACHWCHVMERESFESEAIAKQMNEQFVCIKVDREERPDVDQIYMAAVQLISSRGGWPMSVFLTPDGEPFFGGTYWPPNDRMGMRGFSSILTTMHDYWVNRREDIIRSAAELVEALDSVTSPSFDEAPLTEEVLRRAVRDMTAVADRTHGGFGDAPKFPHPMDIRVLLRGWKRFGDEEALTVARLALDKMALGGIYDHLGGGFHRYSTDRRWLVPHFEKMLYDNALLVPAYLEAFQITRSPLYDRVARETLDYVLREMTQPDGGFYSTQDADSEGVEGKFFVWSEDEIIAALGPDEARVFNYCYDVSTRGNWEETNILNRPKPHDEAARLLGIEPAELTRRLDASRQKLFELRQQRVAPGRDDKVLVSWNGMMIAAMSRGAQVLGDARYLIAAAAAADFILTSMRDPSGHLLHSYKDGRSRFTAYLDDYACLIDGLVDLYQASFDARWLDAGLDLARQMIDRFRDDEDGGFFYTAADHEKLITRTKDSQDNATPSGSSMAAQSLLRLGRITGQTEIEEAGYKALVSLSGLVAKHPRAAGQAVQAVDFQLGPTPEIVVVDGADPERTDFLLSQLHQWFVPNSVLLRRTASMTDATLSPSVAGLLTGRPSGDQPMVYVCQRGACDLPVSTAEELSQKLR